MALEKAYLLLIPADQALSGGSTVNGTTVVNPAASAEDRIDFQFNPETLEITKSANWKRETAAGAETASLPEYKGPQPMKLALNMLFDDTYKKTTGASVSDRVNKLFECCVPTPASIDSQLPSPPFVTFGWGSKLSMIGIVTSVKATYSLFSPDGLPIRADCDVSLEEVPSVKLGQNPTSGAKEARRSRVTVAGDTLPLIAHREYRQAAYWRAIAHVNGIDDPMRVPPGSELIVPSITEAVEYA